MTPFTLRAHGELEELRERFAIVKAGAEGLHVSRRSNRKAKHASDLFSAEEARSPAVAGGARFVCGYRVYGVSICGKPSKRTSVVVDSPART